MQQATPASWMCRRGGMEHGCDFSPFAGKKIYLREILEPLIVKEMVFQDKPKPVSENDSSEQFSGRLGAPP